VPALCTGYLPCFSFFKSFPHPLPSHLRLPPAGRLPHLSPLLLLLLLLQEEDLKDSVLLVFANKQDMRGALNAAQVSEAMGLSSIRSR
jgi:hypothetical protein